MAIDFEEEPPMFQISETHFAKTWLLHPDAPKVEPPEAVKKRMRKLASTFEKPVLVQEGK
jgi:oligopeptide transport system ATP-binding protein